MYLSFCWFSSRGRGHEADVFVQKVNFSHTHQPDTDFVSFFIHSLMNSLLPKKGVCTEDVCVHVLSCLTIKISVLFHLVCVMNIFIHT